MIFTIHSPHNNVFNQKQVMCLLIQRCKYLIIFIQEKSTTNLGNKKEFLEKHAHCFFAT